MQSSRFIILFSLILLFARVTNVILDQDSASDPIQIFAKNDPDIYMLNANITRFTATGARQHKIKAEKFTHFPLTDTTTLKTPYMTLFATQDDTEPWDIAAKHGRLLPKVQVRDEIVELWEKVLAIQEDTNGNFLSIQTDSLTVYPEKDFAETDQKVYIDDNTGRTVAAGMKAYLEEGRFIFYSSHSQRVKTILLPTFD